jgi:hypothetical protein
VRHLDKRMYVEIDETRETVSPVLAQMARLKDAFGR